MSASIAGKNLTGDRNMWRAMQAPWNPPASPLCKPIDLSSFAEFQPPVMVSATGLGTGGGASVGHDAAADYGWIDVYVGLSPAATGLIVVNWPQFPAGSPLLWACDWATLSVTGTVSSGITWTALTPLTPSSVPLRISWRWTVPV